MGDRFRLSVVVPTHRTRELTLRCLAALWLCNPQPDEVAACKPYLQDNRSKVISGPIDQTACSKYKRIKKGLLEQPLMLRP